MSGLRRSGRAVLLAFAIGAAIVPALAVQPDEVIPDTGLESRARAISAELRCLVCQNQSIDDSDAPLAHDLRVLVRDRLRAGDSDAAVRDFVVRRYGEFVLLRPVLAAHTLVLWLGPLLVVLAAVAGMLLMRRRSSGRPDPLTADEETRLKAVLAGDPADGRA